MGLAKLLLDLHSGRLDSFVDIIVAESDPAYQFFPSSE
jgi:hypothetical protein